jgi:REP element-mobilizing transposase RayT
VAKPRKRHVQQEMVFRTWGGARRRAGRKQTNARKIERHRKREELNPIHPVHVVLRVARDVGAMRKRHIYEAIRRATFKVLGRADFRICHVSIQNTHIHLLVEAADEMRLAGGMQAFQISVARRINWVLSQRRGKRRKGCVFIDRYHTEVIDNPRYARHCLSYVLNNWRKHGEDRPHARDWKVDPYSTGMAFYGWKEQPAYWQTPETYARMGVTCPETWLLYGAWELYPPISLHEIPSRPRPRAVGRSSGRGKPPVGVAS